MSFSHSEISSPFSLLPSFSSTSTSVAFSLRLHRMLLKNPLRPLPLRTNPAPPLSLALKLPRLRKEKKLNDLLRDLTGTASMLGCPSPGRASVSMFEPVSPSCVLLLTSSTDAVDPFPFNELPLSEFPLFPRFVAPLFLKEKKLAIPDPVDLLPKSLKAALLILPAGCGSVCGALGGSTLSVCTSIVQCSLPL